MKVTPNDIKSVLVKDEWIMQGLKYGQLSWTQTFNRMGKASPYKKIQNITLGKIAESAVLDYLKNKKIKYTLKGSTKWYEIDIDDLEINNSQVDVKSYFIDNKSSYIRSKKIGIDNDAKLKWYSKCHALVPADQIASRTRGNPKMKKVFIFVFIEGTVNSNSNKHVMHAFWNYSWIKKAEQKDAAHLGVLEIVNKSSKPLHLVIYWTTEKNKDYVKNDLREGDLTDRAGLAKKLQEKYGIDSSQAKTLAETIQSDLEQNDLNDKKIALTNPEREAKLKKLEKERAEVQQEVQTIGDERSGQLNKMNIANDVFGGVKVAFKKLQGMAKDGVKVTAEDVARQQGKDWNKMSEKEKKAFQATVDLVDADVNETENETTKKYKKIEEESTKKATEQIEEETKNYNVTEEEKEKKIRERSEKLQKEELEKAGLDGKSLEKGEEEKNKNFDPKEAVDRISRLLEAIASKLGVNTKDTATDSSVNAKTENNGGWYGVF